VADRGVAVSWRRATFARPGSRAPTWSTCRPTRPRRAPIGGPAVDRAGPVGGRPSRSTSRPSDRCWRGRRAAVALVRSIHPDLLFATAAETEALLGRYAVDDLLEFAPLAVVKRGALGATILAFAADGSRLRFEVATEAVATTDSTGAGDAFDAGFLVAWLSARRAGGGVRRRSIEPPWRPRPRPATVRPRPELPLG
jgi:hypothetical protein